MGMQLSNIIAEYHSEHNLHLLGIDSHPIISRAKTARTAGICPTPAPLYNVSLLNTPPKIPIFQPLICTMYTLLMKRHCTPVLLLSRILRPIHWFRVIWIRYCGLRGAVIIQTDTEWSCVCQARS